MHRFESKTGAPPRDLLMRPRPSRTSFSLTPLAETDDEDEPPHVNTDEKDAPAQTHGVNGDDAVSPQVNDVNAENVVSPQANDGGLSVKDVVSPQANGANGVDVDLPHANCENGIDVSPIVNDVNEVGVSDNANDEDCVDVLHNVSSAHGMGVASQVNEIYVADVVLPPVENNIDENESGGQVPPLLNDVNAVEVSAGVNGDSGMSGSPHVNDENEMDVSPLMNEQYRVNVVSPHVNGVTGVAGSPNATNGREASVVSKTNGLNGTGNGTDTSQQVSSVRESDVSPEVNGASRPRDVSQGPEGVTAGNVNGVNRQDVSQPVKRGTNGVGVPHGTIAKGTDTPSSRPSKTIPTLLTSFEKEFIGESVKDNARKQREKERYLISLSEAQKELQQRSVDSLHRSLDMDKIRGYFEWQRMLQDRFLYRNAEIRRSNSMNMNVMGEEDKKPKLRFRQADHHPLCPRLLSMDYPAGIRVKLRKKLEVERIEMRRVNPPDPEQERIYQEWGMPCERDRRVSNTKEVQGKLPQQKPIESWNPRSGGFPPRPAVTAVSNDGDGEENRPRGILSRRGKMSKGNKAIVWSDTQPRSRKSSTNLKRSLVHSAKGRGRQMEVESLDYFPDPRRTMSAAEPVRPKKEGAVLEKDLRLPPARAPTNHPLGHLLPHDHARRDSDAGVERKFVADLIREAKQQAKDNPNIKTRPLVIYLP